MQSTKRTRAVILAGGEGSRLGILTNKRTKPAVPFAGKYRIIDFTLSNCVNSGIFDVMILAQYRPHSLIEHIGSGGPWDLNRDFTGGVRILPPYKARNSSDWYLGTADAVQQNFRFIKSGDPQDVLILSGDHIYSMNYDAMITFHRDMGAELTMATINVPPKEASRFGIVGVDDDYRVTSFVEKPSDPPSNLANMGIYLFDLDVLDKVLWKDRQVSESSHDFGKDILPHMISKGLNVRAFPFSGYWVDVGTIKSYWKAHLDLLRTPPPIELNDRSWIIHTRTEERPPARISQGSVIEDSLITDGCVISKDARIEQSVLSPGVSVNSGAHISKSIIATESVISENAFIQNSIVDKRVQIGKNAQIGIDSSGRELTITMIGKNSRIPDNQVIESGAVIGTDVVASDFSSGIIRFKETVQTSRKPYEF